MFEYVINREDYVFICTFHNYYELVINREDYVFSVLSLVYFAIYYELFN
jgi:hypothetical protein